MKGAVEHRTILPHFALGRKKVVRRSSFEAWKAANETATIATHSEMGAVGAAQTEREKACENGFKMGEWSNRPMADIGLENGWKTDTIGLKSSAKFRR